MCVCVRVCAPLTQKEGGGSNVQHPADFVVLLSEIFLCMGKLFIVPKFSLQLNKMQIGFLNPGQISSRIPTSVHPFLCQGVPR